MQAPLSIVIKREWSLLTPTLVSAMLTSSITGAGLVIAFYGLIANMSDKMFSTRRAQIKENRKEIDQIRSNPRSFEDSELSKTTQKLNDLSKKVNSVNKFPRYIEIGVGTDFILFIISALFCTQWLNLYSQPNNPTINDWLLVIWFMVTIALFAVVGILGISDVRSTLKYQFSKLAEEKTEIKQEIANAPREIELIRRIELFLKTSGISYHKEAMIKHDSRMRIDMVVPSIQNPRYLIEVKANPISDLVYIAGRKYESLAKELNAKTILICNFAGKEEVKKTAEAYWDFVIDIDNLSQLRDILQSKV